MAEKEEEKDIITGKKEKDLLDMFKSNLDSMTTPKVDTTGVDEQIKKLSKRINIKITKIGSITNKPNQIINSNGNYLKSIKNKGYLHKFK